MIRTTISRIKKVWAVTFSPRLLRGDIRYPPGKFQILTSTAPTTSLVRTKSNDCIYEDSKKRAKYGVADEERDIFDDYMPQELQAGTRHGAPKLYKTTSACRCDDCNKVIAEIFGEEPPSSQDENNLQTKVLNNIAQVNMTDSSDCDKFVSDSRIQGGLFNPFNKGDNESLPEMKKEKDDTDSITMTKDNYRSVLCHEVVLMNNRRGNKSESNDMDTHQMYTNLYDVDPEDYQLGCSHDDNSLLSDKKGKEQNKDAYWNHVYETAVGENSVYCEPTLSIDTDTLNTYNALKRRDTEVKDTSLGVRQMKYSPRELEKMFRKSSHHANEANAKGMIINAKKLDNRQLGKVDTGKDLDEDQLTQKIEHIEETPIVEAEKSKIERSFGSLKILGYAKKTDELNSLDEVAKRCLTSHHNQIDEILLQEMERLGIPLTVQKSTRGLKMGDIQADALNNLSKTTPDMATELDNREVDNTIASPTEAVKKSNNLEELKELETKPLKLDNQYYFDLQRTAMVDDYKQKQEANSEYAEPATNTNTGDVSNENNFRWLYWRADNDGQPKRSGATEEDYNTNFTDSIWQKNQLDPKHVLTCNETCSISPKPLTTTNYMNRIDGSEVMFHQQNVQENENMQEEPLLEDGGSNAYAIRSERGQRKNLQHTKTPNYINASKAEDFTDFINATNSTIMPGKQEQVTNAQDYLNLVGMSHSEMIKRGNTIENAEATLELSNEIKNESNIIEATNEQLQATSEQLQAASVQLQATCVHLQNTTEKLQETTEQLQATSDNLLDSSDKLHAASSNLYTTSEKLQHTSQKLRDTSEQLGFDMQSLISKVSSYPIQAPQEHMWDMNEEADRADEMYLKYGEKARSYDGNNATANKNYSSFNSTTPIINTSITASMNPNYKPEIIPCVTPATASIITETVNSLHRMKNNPIETKQTETKDMQDIETVRTDDENYILEIPTKAMDPKIEGWTQQATAINPEAITEDSPTVQPLPEINNRVKLSELMRLVRERNRLVDCHEGAVLKKPVRKDIIPMAMPMANPPDIKVPGYPTLKPIPRICVPKRRPNTKTLKCSGCDTETLGLNQDGPLMAQNDSEGPVVLEQQPIDFTLIEEDYRTDLTEEFILQLHSLGNEIESCFKRSKTEILEAAVLAKTNHLAKIFRSNDYEPWSPIPSWPYPKKNVRQKVQCPKDGCKIPPPRLIEDKPCGLKPCESFPTFPKRTFSLLDCYPVFLGDHKVVDVGQF